MILRPIYSPPVSKGHHQLLDGLAARLDFCLSLASYTLSINMSCRLYFTSVTGSVLELAGTSS